MLTRLLVCGVLMLLLDACRRLSPIEQKVVGTWKQQTIDSTDYQIFRPDYSYATVSNLNNKELELLCSGHWHIEGEEIVTECSTPRSPELEKELPPPRIFSDRLSIGDLHKYFEPSLPISYKSP